MNRQRWDLAQLNQWLAEAANEDEEQPAELESNN